LIELRVKKTLPHDEKKPSVLERWVTVLSLIALPLITALAGAVIKYQSEAKDRDHDYVALAVALVESGNVRSPDLESWAKDTLQRHSKVGISPSLGLSLVGREDNHQNLTLPVLRESFAFPNNFMVQPDGLRSSFCFPVSGSVRMAGFKPKGVGPLELWVGTDQWNPEWRSKYVIEKNVEEFGVNIEVTTEKPPAEAKERLWALPMQSSKSKDEDSEGLQSLTLRFFRDETSRAMIHLFLRNVDSQTQARIYWRTLCSSDVSGDRQFTQCSCK
jgi:hypothetical protein